MTIEDVMTRDVITVSPEASIHMAARLMAEHEISGLPVIDGAGRLVGIVSEGDLILRQRPRTARRPWWRTFLDDPEALAREYCKATGITVGEVMTRPVLSISPAFEIETAAAILHSRGLRRLPVVRDGQLVGIISRGDLVKALAAKAPPTWLCFDADLVSEMKARLANEAWAPTAGFSVHASDGVIVLGGVARSEAQRAALETMARAIEGCRGVENLMTVEPPASIGFIA